MDETRLKDAVKWMNEAEKHTSKGWFKKPDWDIAAQYYEKAATSFKAGKSYEQSVQAFIKASDAMFSASSMFMSARAMENGGNVAAQNLGQPERAADMYKKASSLYMQNMTPDKSAEMLEKAAKAMEPISVDTAIELYVSACNIYEHEDRAKYSVETFKKTISLLVKHKRFEKASEVLQRLAAIQQDSPNKTALFKTFLSIIIVSLAIGDEVDAGKKFQGFCVVDGFVKSEESAVAHAMLDAFEHQDQQYYNQTAARQHIGFLDNEIARLARSLEVSGDLISGGGYQDHSQPPQQQQQGYPGQPGQFAQQQPMYQQQQQRPPPHQQQQFPPQGNQLHQPRPVYEGSSQPLPQQPQKPMGGYDRPPPQMPPQQFNGPPPNQNLGRPPMSDDPHNTPEWRALTASPAPRQPPPPMQNQQPPQNTQNQQRPQQPPQPAPNAFYDDLEDDDDLL